jgi:phosphoglycolate phosphatase
MEENKLAVLVPGIGYHRDKPLLYYATKLLKSEGYAVKHIEFHDLPGNIRGDAAMMKVAAEMAFSQMEEQLREVDFAEYSQLPFVGKSIGTVVSAKFVSTRKLPAKQIWYTPLERTFDYCAGEVSAFIGDADPWSDINRIRELAERTGVRLFIYEKCNHSLETGDVETDINTLREVMKLTYRTIEGTEI